MAWYPSLLMLHVAFAATWLAGMLVVAAACFPAAEPAGPTPFLHGLARWNRRLIWPAMLLAIGGGVALATLAGWFGQGWLHAKLVLVALLVLLQVGLTVVLRRLASRAAYRSPGWVLPGCIGIFMGGLGVILLAAVKPQF